MKKIKKAAVPVFDKRLRKEYGVTLSFVCGIISGVSIIVADYISQYRVLVVVVYLVLLLVIFVALYLRANFIAYGRIRKKLGKVILYIEYGDLFQAKGLIAISFNEYFDTIVGEGIISPHTLNGKFLNKSDIDPKEIARSIEQDNRLKKYENGFNSERKRGNKKKFSLGTVHRYKDFLLVAFSKFDEENHAYLSLEEYFSGLLNFWRQVSEVYEGARSIAISLMGSGITRLKSGTKLTPEDLLDLIIVSLKYSQDSFAYGTQVKVILHESMQDYINLYSFWDRKE